MSSYSRAVSYWNRHWWTKVLFLVVLLLVLVWKSDPAAVAHSFLHIDWRWMLAAVAVDLLAIFLKGINHKIVFDALGTTRVRVMEAFSATSIGLMVNWLVPARLGEVARAYALQVSLRRRDVFMPVVTIFGTVLGERLFAIASIVAMAALLLIGVGTPPWARTTLIVGGFVVGAIIVALALYENWRKRSVADRQHVEFTIAGRRFHVPTLHAHPPGAHRHVPHLHAPSLPRLRDRLRVQALGHLVALGESQRIMGRPGAALLEFAAQVVTWIVQLLIYYTVILAFRIEPASLGAAAMVMIATNIIGLVPITPGNWGTFQAAAVGALAVFGADHEEALAYAIGLQGMQTVVGVGLGFAFLSISHLSLQEVERASLAGEEELEMTLRDTGEHEKGAAGDGDGAGRGTEATGANDASEHEGKAGGAEGGHADDGGETT
ncbi:MAG TPA: lysylphosphatidylglycerol synthase transmembrane domain-containing protein [Thermoleophilia bacterium]|nr:lysylphosphatidylglycerol synthase transmembrane domain-containing protein [Thermoleophilia bacterium]